MNRYCIPTPNQDISESIEMSMQSDVDVVELETRIWNSLEKPYAFKGQKFDNSSW